MSGTSSSGEIISARGFQLTDQAVIKSYFSNVHTEWAKRWLPGISEGVEWTVYKLSPSGLFKHFSLLFVCEDKPYIGSPGFTFELECFVGGQSGNYVAPKTIFWQGSGTIKLGVIRDSAEAIMNRGLICLAKFGDYHNIINNCQSFCSKFAGELSISQPWTDGEKAALGLGLAAGALALVALFSSASGDHQGEQQRRN